MNEYECRSDWFVRDNPEFDEKLPLISKEIIFRGINFTQLGIDSDEGDEVCAEMMEACCEHLECFGDLTADEIEYYLEFLVVGCELVIMTEEGVLEEKNGKLSIPDD